MKGLILAGGTGSRLRPITHTTQKQLVPVANKPVIQYAIESLRAAGITEIGVVVGGQFPEKVKDFIGDGSKFNVDLTYILQGEPLGLAHAVGCARPFVDGDPFVVYFGDTIIDDEIIARIVESFTNNDCAAHLALKRVENPSRYGIADIVDDRVRSILEKPDDPPTDLAYVGAVAVKHTIFDTIDDLDPSWRGELELTHALDSVVETGSATWDIVDGTWIDVGTPADVIEANRVLLDDIERDIAETAVVNGEIDGPVAIADDCTIDESATVEGPAVIGPNTVVGPDTTIGPYASVGTDGRLESTTVSSSVLMDEVDITGGHVRNSVVGCRSEVEARGQIEMTIADDTHVLSR
ncbi:glucose-1-phosphate thymidylyltransferase [Halorientalis pallida]|uniref:glucose-1-phosphate thymidylyltransferase n=1 Tax=Halorientalis pallida TaxID=2479928 RepID=UPI003C70226F